MTGISRLHWRNNDDYSQLTYCTFWRITSIDFFFFFTIGAYVQPSVTMVKLGLPLALALSLFLGVSDAQIKRMTLGGHLTSGGSIQDWWRCFAYVTGCNGETHLVGCSSTGSPFNHKESCSSDTIRHSDGFDLKIEECNSRDGMRLKVNDFILTDDHLSLGSPDCTDPTDNTFLMECTWRNDYELVSCF